MNRITHKYLEARVARLNRALDRPVTPYTHAHNKMTANIGNLHISGAYGGVALYEMENEGGGVNDLSGGHVSKRELSLFIDGMLKALEIKA